MDSNLQDGLDDLFRDAIEPLRALPGENVWENVERQLAREETNNYKRIFITIRKMIAIVVFLLLCFITTTIIYLNNYSGKNKRPKANYGNRSHRRADDSLTGNNMANQLKEMDTSNNNTSNSKVGNIKREGQTMAQKKQKETGGRFGDKPFTVTANTARKEALFEMKVRPAPDVLEEKYTRQAKLPVTLYNYYNSNVAKINAGGALPLGKKQNSEGLGANNHNGLSADSGVVSKSRPSAAEHTKGTNRLFKRFSFSAFTAPEFAAYNLENDETSQFDSKQKLQNRENNLISASGGILVGYKLTRRFMIQAGITFSLSHVSIDPSKIYAIKDNAGSIIYRYNTSSGYSDFLPSFSSAPAIGDSLYTGTAKHTLQYFSIPLIASYHFENKKFSFAPGIGIVLNFLTKATLETEVGNLQNKESENFSKLEGLKKVSGSILLSTEFQYNISKKWAISAMPYFKYALTPSNSGYIIKTYPYNIGLGLGAVYRF